MIGLAKEVSQVSEEGGSRAGMVKVWLVVGGGDLGQRGGLGSADIALISVLAPAHRISQ